jgi:hypothetical protein
MSHRMTVFVSYSHRDSRWLERLQVHLKPFGRRGDLALWDDTRIDVGDRWRSAIRSAIDRAAASILLISADFLASDFVASDELPPLLQKAEKAGARVIPIVVQPCRLANHPELASFQTLNPPNKPLSRLSDAEAEEVFVRAADQVERVLSTRSPIGRSAAEANGEPRSDEASAHAFDDLQSTTIALSILSALRGSAEVETDQTLTDLTRTLNIRSRRLAHDAVERFEKAGWVEKRRVAGRTAFRIAPEGLRQLQRLAAAADWPVRLGVTPRR